MRDYLGENDHRPLAKITRQDGNLQTVSLMAMEDDIHSKIHQGGVFFVPLNVDSVANNAFVYAYHMTGDTYDLHSIININTVGKWKFEAFAEPTISDDGTPLTPINRNGAFANTMESIFYKNPDVTDVGTPRLSFYFGGGTTPARASTSQYQESLESVFPPNAKVLIKLTNLSGNAQYLSVVLNCYEE